MQNTVFALGNALVDYEYKVSDELLKSIGLFKGSAKLAITSKEQQEMFDLLANSDADFIKKASGGSAANTMFAISALGGTSGFSFRVSDDEAGRFYLADMQKSGVNTSVDACTKNIKPTGSCLVMVTDDAERTMQAHLGVSGEINFSCVDETLLKKSSYVYIEGYLASNPISVEAIIAVKEFARLNNTKVALSFSDPSVVNFSNDALLSILDGGVDVLFCNQEEVAIFTGEADLQKATQLLHEHSDLVIVTLGSEGAFVSHKTQNGVETFTTAAFRSDTVIDTNGAGDNFAGAFLYGMTKNMSLRHSTELAVQVAGHLVENFGPRMPKAMYTKILENFNSQLST